MPKIKKCSQCRESNLKLTKAWNNQYYCADCTNWNEEAEQSGIAACYRYTSLDCENCAECASCLKRKKLKTIPTQDLLIEIFHRKDYQALITWEDDGFQHRIQEIVWELKISKGLTAKQIRAKVNEDIQKKASRRKYSRGV